ncbi:DEAD/DEAH box helicase [Litorilinea aerophila]|uniref:DEAD/DEAH box helicase n=1 Tax=Litorilinea aerophila TaxID=1204385 RepID=A0A540VHC9_9CHLR|nr:DEAD/DEAH box helicase [Litorilinea aerophila]MCC9076225.1 DEAD/DEAH box helicase [Litorilinea aerophila]
MIERTRDIRARLKYAWTPFFTRFGRLTPIQLEAIPRILDGSNVIIASPTASGKTEAVVAPVAQKFIEERWYELAVVYVVPTRALTNDTIARVAGPLQDMGIRADIKHGDKPYLSTSNPPNFLVITPESLDSLICRNTELFSNLQTVIIDEIHLLDNTYRGDQLRILISRLRKIAKVAEFSVHLLSATLASPRETAGRYVQLYETVEVPGRREIEYQFVESHKEIYEIARQRKWRKILYFCNLRETVEETVSEISRLWHPYPVVAHHGSLNRQLREEAERVMKEADVAICVSTSTLEVGIDIGDLDLIVLVEPPWSVSSLLQRIGRGNRREGIVRVAALVTSSEERQLLESMFEVAASGELPEEPYNPDLSVAVQQIFSCLYQNRGGVLETEIVSLLSPICNEKEATLILRHLRSKEWVERATSRWFASTKLMDLGAKGRIHSNIPESQSHRVIDVASGREIGLIMGVVDEVFVLGGRVWQIVSIERNMIKVRRFMGRAQAAFFLRRGRVGAFYYLLPPELRNKLA